MKRTCLSLPRLACGFAALLTISAAADVPMAPEGTGSSYFAAASQHLELGGQFFAWIDLDGDMKTWGEFGDKMLNFARKQSPGQIPDDLKITAMLDSLGLTGVKGMGMSSRKGEGNLYHNRTFIPVPDGRKGLLKLMGGEAAAFAAPAFAPAGSDIVVEQDITLSSLTETIEQTLVASGFEGQKDQMKMYLAFPVPGLPMTIGDFIAKLDTKMIAVAHLVPGKSFDVPGQDMTVPAFRAVLSLDKMGFLFEPMTTMSTQSGKAVVEKGEGFELIRPAEALPAPFDFFTPVLYHDLKSDRLLLSTHLDYVRECLAGTSSVSSDDSFKKAMTGLPTTGNGMSYITASSMKTIMDFYMKAMKASQEMSGNSEATELMDELMSAMQDISALPTSAIASAQCNLPDGMLFASNTPETHKSTIAQALIIPAAVVAGGVAGYQQTMTRLQEGAEGAESEPTDEDSDEDAAPADAPAARAVKNNLQQIAFAGQSWFLDNPSSREVTYKQLLDAQLLFKLKTTAGESYDDVSVKRGGGTLSVKTRGGDAVELKYPAVTD